MPAGGSNQPCSDLARARGDDLVATAGPAARFLLVEVNGPWGRGGLQDSRFDRYRAGRLEEAADAAGVRLLLIRRPGRHAAPGAEEPIGHTVALADVRSGHRGVQWHPELTSSQVLELDLHAPVVPRGPQQVVLVCTHGRHDLCCAVRGRPVATALAGRAGWDVWECSHLGGDRFAPNLLFLPGGDLYGGLDPAGALALLDLHQGGRLDLLHHRGWFGRPATEQAAVLLAARAWGVDRRDGVAVTAVHRRGEHDWDVRLRRGSGPGASSHEARLVSRWSAPFPLTCRTVRPSRVLTYRLEGLTDPVD